MKIGNREIGPGQSPYIIAEVSCNHGGSLDRAFELIDAAATFGADAVKFQCYTPDSMTIDCGRPEFVVHGGPWDGMHLWDLYEEAQTPLEWFPLIKARAERRGIHWFASVFDKQSVDLMVELDAPAIKIASFEITDIPLIRYAAATGKPLIVSTGMAQDGDIAAVWSAAGPNLMFLVCTSGYPTPYADVGLQNVWGRSGISDHSVGPEVPIAATALGAAIIEKHFRLSWHPDTEDSTFSLDEIEFAQMVRSIRNTWAAMQPRSFLSEESQRPLRRSLFVVAAMHQGDVFTSANLRSIRPSGGLPPKDIDAVLGLPATRNIERGEPLAWDMVDLGSGA